MSVNYANRLMPKQTLFIHIYMRTQTQTQTNKRTDKVQKGLLTIASCVRNEDIAAV